MITVRRDWECGSSSGALSKLKALSSHPSISKNNNKNIGNWKKQQLTECLNNFSVIWYAHYISVHLICGSLSNGVVIPSL
jgi:hypothetical protein